MHWITEYYKEVKQATDEQLRLWLQYMNMFNDNEISADSIKREKYRELIHVEMKMRGLRLARSRERGKAKKYV